MGKYTGTGGTAAIFKRTWDLIVKLSSGLETAVVLHLIDPKGSGGGHIIISYCYKFILKDY